MWKRLLMAAALAFASVAVGCDAKAPPPGTSAGDVSYKCG